jgi:hypothetical protein
LGCDQNRWFTPRFRSFRSLMSSLFLRTCYGAGILNSLLRFFGLSTTKPKPRGSSWLSAGR